MESMHHYVVSTSSGLSFIVSIAKPCGTTIIIAVDPFSGDLSVCYYDTERNGSVWPGVKGSLRPNIVPAYVNEATALNALRRMTGERTLNIGDPLYALLGFVIHGNNAWLLAANQIDRAALLGDIHEVFMVTSTSWIKIPLYTDRQVSRRTVKNFEILQHTPFNGFHYYCMTFDITRPFPSVNLPHDYVDEFRFNAWLSAPFDRAGLSDIPVVLLQGSVVCEKIRYHGELIVLSLLTRRSHGHAGTNLHACGLNEDGYVGNAAESELIVTTQDVGFDNDVSPIVEHDHSSYVDEHDIALRWRSFVWCHGGVPVWYSYKQQGGVDTCTRQSQFDGSDTFFERLCARFYTRSVTLLNLLPAPPMPDVEKMSYSPVSNDISNVSCISDLARKSGVGSKIVTESTAPFFSRTSTSTNPIETEDSLQRLWLLLHGCVNFVHMRRSIDIRVVDFDWSQRGSQTTSAKDTISSKVDSENYSGSRAAERLWRVASLEVLDAGMGSGIVYVSSSKTYDKSFWGKGIRSIQRQRRNVLLVCEDGLTACYGAAYALSVLVVGEMLRSLGIGEDGSKNVGPSISFKKRSTTVPNKVLRSNSTGSTNWAWSSKVPKPTEPSKSNRKYSTVQSLDDAQSVLDSQMWPLLAKMWGSSLDASTFFYNPTSGLRGNSGSGLNKLLDALPELFRIEGEIAHNSFTYVRTTITDPSASFPSSAPNDNFEIVSSKSDQNSQRVTRTTSPSITVGREAVTLKPPSLLDSWTCATLLPWRGCSDSVYSSSLTLNYFRQSQIDTVLGLHMDTYFSDPLVSSHGYCSNNDYNAGTSIVSGPMSASLGVWAGTFCVEMSTPLYLRDLSLAPVCVIGYAGKEHDSTFLVGPLDAQEFDMCLYLAKECIVEGIEITVRYDSCELTSPKSMSVYMGSHRNNMVESLRDIVLPYCNDKTSLYFTLAPTPNRNQGSSGTATARRLFGSMMTSPHCQQSYNTQRVVKIVFRAHENSSCMTLGSIRLFGRAVPSPSLSNEMESFDYTDITTNSACSENILTSIFSKSKTFTSHTAAMEARVLQLDLENNVDKALSTLSGFRKGDDVTDDGNNDVPIDSSATAESPMRGATVRFAALTSSHPLLRSPHRISDPKFRMESGETLRLKSSLKLNQLLPVACVLPPVGHSTTHGVQNVSIFPQAGILYAVPTAWDSSPIETILLPPGLLPLTTLWMASPSQHSVDVDVVLSSAALVHEVTVLVDALGYSKRDVLSFEVFTFETCISQRGPQSHGVWNASDLHPLPIPAGTLLRFKMPVPTPARLLRLRMSLPSRNGISVTQLPRPCIHIGRLKVWGDPLSMPTLPPSLFFPADGVSKHPGSRMLVRPLSVKLASGGRVRYIKLKPMYMKGFSIVVEHHMDDVGSQVETVRVIVGHISTHFTVPRTKQNTILFFDFEVQVDQGLTIEFLDSYASSEMCVPSKVGIY